MHRTLRYLVIGTGLLALPGAAASFAVQNVTSTSSRGQTAIQLSQFNSIDVRNSGHLVIRPASAQRVTLVSGSLEYSRVAVTDGGRLVVDRCHQKCPKGYRLEIEVLVPGLAGISLANGGTIQSRGSFQRQGELTVAVRNGGTIDVRSMPANRVTASVDQGGRILTLAQAWLFARVSNGGVITYWGDGQVRSSVGHGGAVNRGSPGQENLPLSEYSL
jgi:hypothetical protein